MAVTGRCNHPLGNSEALPVTCARPKGHDGPHRSAFERKPDQERLCRRFEGAVEHFRVWSRREDAVAVLHGVVQGSKGAEDLMIEALRDALDPEQEKEGS